MLYTKVFSARGAFLHVGAFVGTIMAFNVFMIIIPNQRDDGRATCCGARRRTRSYGIIGKQRSTHNNYLTLPVLVMMVSPHYPFLSAHPQAWLVVALIIIAGAPDPPFHQPRRGGRRSGQIRLGAAGRGVLASSARSG